MKIFIVGSTGRVASKLIDQLVIEGHQILAGSRHPQNIRKHPQISAVFLDLHDDLSSISETIGKVDTIYFTAGSRGKNLLQTDVFGAIKIMQAAGINGVSRFIMLSSIFSLEPEQWKQKGLKEIPDYNVAKFLADTYLVHNTKLDYTILQPTNLVDKKGSQKITIDNGKFAENSIENVAITLAGILKFDNTIHKIIKMRDGETPINDALRNV